MYHAIWRDSSGKKWITAREDLGTFSFTASTSTHLNGISEAPGYFPVTADNGQILPPQLRYSDGSAAAWSDKLSPPDTFIGVYGETVGRGFLEPSSVTITGAVPKQRGVSIDFFGKGQDGYGYIKAHKPFILAYNTETFDYDADNSLAAPVQGRTYYIDSTTSWSAKTYLLEFEIEVTYESTSANGSAHIRHVDRNGNPIPTLTDRQDVLELNQAYSSTHTAAPTGYSYAGYAKTITGIPPTNFTSPTAGEYAISSYTGTFDTLYLYYVYDVDPNANKGHTHVRHMVRSSPTGAYVQAAESTTAVVLPYTHTHQADSNSYGTVIGRSVSYTGYSNTITATSSAYVYLDGTTTTKDVYITFFYEKTKSITGDFEIIPDHIAYRDSFALRPTNVQLNGCTYQGHQWKIERNGMVYTSPIIKNQKADTNFDFSQYPSVLSVGTHQVYMKIITTDCGDSNWIGPKLLEVTGPAANHPPQFKIAWVRASEPLKPVTEVLEGETLNLVVIQDPTIPTPTDPDGDTITFDGFNFASDWGKQIPNKYAEGWMSYNNIVMDSIGTHSVTAAMHDAFGASATAFATIRVVPPNPIAIIEGPNQVVEGRPLPSQFKADKSYSPVGRAIDHSKDEWINRKSMYATPGKELIRVDVYDSIGLKSVVPAEHELTVLEDLPPVVDLQGSLAVVRNVTYPYNGTATSPDGDKIVSVTIKRAYDANNDGSFAGEMETSLTISPTYAFQYSYPKVGKYRYTICATEDWGKSACKQAVVEAVNDSPTVSFEVSSTVTEPPLYVPVPINTRDIVSSTNWRNTDVSNQDKPKAWSVNSNGALGSIPYNAGDYTITGGEHSTYRALSAITESQSTNISDETHLPNDGNQYNIYSNALMLGDGYFAYTMYSASGGAPTIPIFNKNGFIFARGFGTSNGYSWYGESVGAIDLYQGIVVTLIRTSQATKYAVYTIESFINPSGKPYAILDSYQASNTTTADQANKKLAGPYFDFKPFTDSNGSYLTIYPWSNASTSGTLTKGGCIETLNCAFGARLLSSYFGRYSVLRFGSSGAISDGIFIVDVAQHTSKKIADTEFSSYAPGVGWLLSKDEKYLLRYADAAGNWSLMDVSTGVINQTGIGPKYRLLTQFNDYVAFLDQANNRIIGYKFGETLTQLWTNSNNYQAIAAAEPETHPVTNDGFMYFHDSVNTLMTLDVRTGQMRSLGAIPTDGYRTTSSGTLYIRKMKLVTEDTVEVQMRYSSNSGADFYITSWMSGTALKSDTSPIGSQNQLMSSTNLSNVQLAFTARLNDVDTDQLYAGFSYRMADNENMYRVEWNRKTIRLVKVINGTRFVIKAAPLAVSEGAWLPIKIIAQDERHKVYANGVPLIDANDADLKKGYFGPYAEIPRTEFKAIAYADMDSTASSAQYSNVAIVGGDVNYNDHFNDPENDPAVQALTKWTYTKIAEKFLDAGDGNSGESALNGKTYTKPQRAFDKVGVYRISYSSTDDSHPDHLYADMSFAAYRGASNTYTADVIVHRRPVSRFVIQQQADGKIAWTDFSRDPDRYLNASTYSTEATGIDYFKTRGVLEKKFYYITPSGKMVKEKLVTPQETGSYEIGMAVRDEYGAWSDYFVASLDADKVAPSNTSPVPGFTSSHINTFRGVPVTFNSLAYDKEDGGRENVVHEYYMRNLTAMSTETLQSISRTSWTKTFSSLGTFNIRQVVEDKEGVSAQYELQVSIHNRPPEATINTPNSNDQSKPTKFDVTRPVFKWSYNDGDGDAQKQFQMRIYRYGGILQADTNTRTGSDNTFVPNAELPEK